MNFKVPHRAAELTAPAIWVQYLLAQLPIITALAFPALLGK
jgi:hypothetical protein